jgi:hypothetical protein
MKNKFGRWDKAELRRRLFGVGVDTLQKNGWKVERVQGVGKSSMRRITKGAESKLVSIRTSQDTWIAFPRNKKDQTWVTLSDVDTVVAVSVDDRHEPCFAQVHLIDGDEMRDRFDRAYTARKAAGRSIPLGRGVWVSLYHHEAQDPVNQVGAGAGLAHPPIARVSLNELAPIGAADGTEAIDTAENRLPDADNSLTVGEAKRRLAITYGVDPSNVKIIIEA